MDILNFLKEQVISNERMMLEYNRPVKRSLYELIKERPQIQIIHGLRGTGKTTLLFQKFSSLEKNKRIYLSGDHMSILKIKLIDLDNYLNYVIDDDSWVFLDEATTLQNWAEELKVLADRHPKKTFIVSGSSSFGLNESKKSLARRAVYYHLLPLSFREYIHITKNIMLEKFNISSFSDAVRYEIYFKEKIKENPIDLVNEYAMHSLPYLLENELSTLRDLVQKIIYEDIRKSEKFNPETLGKFERLIFYLSLAEKTSFENIANDLSTSKSTVGEMLIALVKSDLIKEILPYGAGRKTTRVAWKYSFTSPAIRYLYLKLAGAPDSRINGLIHEDLFTSHLENVLFLKEGPDFVYNNAFFEIGSENKNSSQLKNVSANKKYIIYDGIDVKQNEDVIWLPFFVFLSSI